MVEKASNENQSIESSHQADKMMISSDQAFELLESISVAFYGIDANWCFTYLNRKAEALWGKKREDLIGKNIWEVFPQGVNTQSYFEMHEALERQEARHYESFSAFLNKWVEVEVNPTGNGLSVFFHDISQRKEAEERLKNNEKRLHLISDALPERVSYFDTELRFQFLNKDYEKILGRDRSEVIGKPMLEVIGPTAFETARADIEAALSGQSILYEREIAYPTGTRVSRTQLIPHRLDDGTVIGIVGIVEDITERKRNEEALTHLATIVTSSNDAIITTTTDGIITTWNQAAERMYGYSASEAIHAPIKIILPPDKIDEENRFFQLVAAGQAIRNYDTMRQKKDGSLIYVSVTISPLKDKEGKIFGISKIARDITERKRIEAEILQSQADLKQAQSLAHLGTWAWHVQTNHLEWSHEMFRNFGMDKETFTGKLDDVINRAIHPDDRAMVEQANLALIQNQQASPVEYRVIWPDGTEHILWGQAGGIILDSAGNPSVITGIVQDITERKQNEIALKRYAQRMEVLHQIDMGLIQGISMDALVDLTLKQLQQLIPCQRLDLMLIEEDKNEALVFAVRHQNSPIIGAGVRIPIPIDAFVGYDVRNMRLFDDIRLFQETQPRAKRLVEEGLVSALSVMLLDQGKVIAVLGMFADRVRFFTSDHQDVVAEIANQLTIAIRQVRLSEKIAHYTEELEQKVLDRTAKLQAVNQELDSFAYIVSHDLKAPLRGITQLASWLITDYGTTLDDEAHNMLKLMVARTKRMHEMIEGILAYSRIGRIKENRVQINLKHLISEVVDLLAAPDGIHIRQAADMPVIYADETSMRQVLQNLVGNAIKYMGKPTGEIEISCQDLPEYWQFTIADTGVGIAPQYHDKVFQLFQTLAPRDEIESTGIGLALVKKIIELHDGRIWLDSALGQGSKFYFTLAKHSESKPS
jgi:PAS domain S-box-containing protein